MAFRELLKILEAVEMDIAISEPEEKRVVKTFAAGPDDSLPLTDFPCVMNWPESIVDNRYTNSMNDVTHTVRVQILYGIAGQAENREVAIALFDAAYKLFDRERQADRRLGVDEAHLLDIVAESPLIGDIPWASVDGKGYTGSQLLLSFSVMDRRVLATDA